MKTVPTNNNITHHFAPEIDRNKEIAVLVSGGVDSSVALALLKQQGFTRLRAYYLKIWLEDELAFLGECPWQEDLDFIQKVAGKLDVPVEVVPMQSEYLERIIGYVISELKMGRTPSPDVFCNQRIKFGAFVDHLSASCDYVASGHYAQVQHFAQTSHLLKAVDPVKDQTYFLCQLSKKQLRKVLFPIGHLPKSEVRLLAESFGLATMHRKDSQGLCFLGKIKYDEFIRYHLGNRKGSIIDWNSGKKLGEHEGYWFHTIGQRKGLGLSGGPWFVVRKSIEDNIVYVCHEDQGFAQSSRYFLLPQMNWLMAQAELNDQTSLPLTCKVRHGAKVYPCHLYLQSDGHCLVEIHPGDRGLAEGQIAVFYQGEVCLGGGVIQPLAADFQPEVKLAEFSESAR